MLEVRPACRCASTRRPTSPTPGQLQQDFITDVNWRTAIGQGSGEAFQLRFQGQGLVYIQPAERAAGIDV